MKFLLSFEEARVISALVEKQLTTPEYYPMSLNGLKNACNQKSNRHPVVQFEEATVLNALDSMRKQQLIMLVSGAGSRVRKYEHRLREQLHLNQYELAALAMLMLRGPQTIGEIRSRTERLADFPDLESVEACLKDLCSEDRNPQPLVQKLPTMPGHKESRYVHLLSGAPDIEALSESFPATAPRAAVTANAAMEALAAQVAALSADLETLREAFESFKAQFED